jgi:hypothetical protein
MAGSRAQTHKESLWSADRRSLFYHGQASMCRQTFVPSFQRIYLSFLLLLCFTKLKLINEVCLYRELKVGMVTDGPPSRLMEERRDGLCGVWRLWHGEMEPYGTLWERLGSNQRSCTSWHIMDGRFTLWTVDGFYQCIFSTVQAVALFFAWSVQRTESIPIPFTYV